MAYWRDEYEEKVSTPRKALDLVKPGTTIYISGGCSRPRIIVEHLLKKRSFHDNRICTPFTFMPSPFFEPDVMKKFRINSFYMDSEVERGVMNGHSDYTPIYTSELPYMFRTGRIKLDVAVIQVSPPDLHGFCSLGTSVDITKSAVESADVVIAEVNRQMPRTLGDSFIHTSQIDQLIEVDYPVEHPLDDEGIDHDTVKAIARNAAKLVHDGATIQIGTGMLPDAILSEFGDKKNLGVHTEMFSDGVMELVKAGVINGSKKTIHPRKIVTSFVIGSAELMEFVDNNPSIEFHPSDYTNDITVIAKNNKMVAINTASVIDLTGQVLADRTGLESISNPGGMPDFIRGALSARGRTIIVMPSTTSDGQTSRIVSVVPKGAGVGAMREDIHYVVTEYGIAHLRGKTLAKRSLELINVAHPSFREKLLDQAVALGYLPEDQSRRSYRGLPYPEELEQTAVFDGQTAIVRPLKPTDEDLVRELFYSFSSKTLQQRFMTTRVLQPREERMSQVNIDYDLSMAFGVFLVRGSMTELIAVCEYERNPKNSSAEVSFAVRDDWQGKGVGTYMVNLLVRVGKSRNIKTFTADVLSTNVGMLNLFYRTGLDVSAKLEDDVYKISFDLVKEEEKVKEAG
ncbi:MAG: GNAT family N-acetyltransferase [Candidatus Methanomethylophilaceae archaeon]|jgi:acyl-CoA hydrolase/RimJ/RimL family protein N-acetyltransferase|nr:GNAT family N-acetyltransferase [Candidatus Methanomethylophilaceae archaeon]MDD2778780.1 GNAT family N-acetyltransferase [Candidatus Methanomethylophilaceae archaeon]MDD4454443.1 GNAT family N-acetyltransferase [Candidatus Methanomethylophilaceae archaeon]MDI9379127.1 GNAT family N-acetyltransferase [Candidatus Thermoplasmatota archaeon]